MEIAAPVTGSFFYTDKGKKNDESERIKAKKKVNM